MSEETKKEEKQMEIPAKFKKIVEEISQMSVLDLSELVKILEEKFQVSSALPMMAGVMPAAAGAETEAAQTTFNVELTTSGDNKIGVIKALREVTQLGLKEAKDMVDGAPKVVKEGVGKEEAEGMKKKIETAGAKVTLK